MTAMFVGEIVDDGVATDNQDGPFIAGKGSERQILVAGTFDSGEVTFELTRTPNALLQTPDPNAIAPATDLAGTILKVSTNRAVNIGPIPVGMQIRAKLTMVAAASAALRADIF